MVGHLAQDGHRVYFEYDDAFLSRGLNLSPLRLPFQRGLFEHTDAAFGPLPGLFDDSLPDGWGRLLMDRHFRARGLQPETISPLHRLAWIGERTMGALTYHPPEDAMGEDDSELDLRALAKQSREVMEGDVGDVLPQLLRAGGSPGGARPKVLVGVKGRRLHSGAQDIPSGFDHWMIKFAAKKDLPDAGPIEYAYALMAQAAGIDMPPVRLFKAARGESYFGVKRFDRESNNRVHVHTFGNLIQANFRIPSCDYADLLQTTSILTRDHQDVLRVFRRMAFNALAHNRDDHVKNFAFLMDAGSGAWRLSPAYDLTASHGPGGEHSMTLAGEGKDPSRGHMMRLAEKSAIARSAASTMIDEVTAVVRHWRNYARQAGVSKSGCATLGQLINR